MQVICQHPDRVMHTRQRGDTILVSLYGVGEPSRGVGYIGHQLLHRVLGLHGQPTQTAWDFLSLALGVVAADTFVRRDASEDGWTRRIHLTVELVDPSLWIPVIPTLERALRFLSGDLWSIEFCDQGVPVPAVSAELPFEDSVCLLSGGLDSLIGAIDLVRSGRSPILVSHAYPKEGKLQQAFAARLGRQRTHFYANAHATFAGVNEISMRCRSLLFIAMGTVAASTLIQPGSAIDLIIPENGLISLNPPLTPRRIGSLSTRTTHPYFLKLVAESLNAVGLDLKLTNPYAFQTKGEMIRECLDPDLLLSLMRRSISCGKWKRKNQPCGRCFPCLIRRAAFYAADEQDDSGYVYDDLRTAASYDDVVAVRTAVERYRNGSMEQVLRSMSPLPESPSDRASLVNVATRGIAELDRFIQSAL